MRNTTLVFLFIFVVLVLVFFNIALIQEGIIFYSLIFTAFSMVMLLLLGYSFILLKTEKDKTEAIISNFTDGIIMYNDRNTILMINPKAEEILKIKAEEILNKEAKTEFFKTEPKFIKLVQVLFPSLAQFSRKIGGKTETYPKIIEIILRPPDNLILQTITFPIYNSNKQAIGFLKIIKDITREKLIEKSKSEFISIAAHQLRTPLSAIKWIFKMLTDGDLGKLTSDQTEFLEKGYEANERMIKLVTDLLDVVRIEEGRFGYAFQETHLTDIIFSVVQNLKRDADAKGIRLIFNPPEVKLPPVKVDVDHLIQATENFIDNAIRYSLPAGEVNISIKKEGQWLKVIIKDTGIGIPSNQLERIFSKFFRAENALRLQTEGNGLGLYISRNIIKRHGGNITVDSEEGKGSTFTFTIPTEEELIPQAEDIQFEEFIKGF